MINIIAFIAFFCVDGDDVVECKVNVIIVKSAQVFYIMPTCFYSQRVYVLEEKVDFL